MKRWTFLLRVPAAVTALGLFVSALHADETWLEPERFAVRPGATTTLWLTSAEEFSGPGVAVQSDEVARALARAAGNTVKIVASTPTDQALPFSATLPKAGVAVFAIELKPQRFELERNEIEPYLRRIHAGDGLRALWADMPSSRRWREDRVTHAKTFVRAGEPAADERAWTEPLGLGLEIVPLRDPTTLRAGDDFPVRVLRASAPLAGFTITFVSADETHEHVVVTDDQGGASAALGIAGLWLLRGTELRRADSEDKEWESEIATLVVTVK